jgi:hypothetical protein
MTDLEAIEPCGWSGVSAIRSNGRMFLRRECAVKRREIQMWSAGLQFRIGGGVSAVLLVLSTPLALSACAAASSYAGIPLAPGAADEDLQQLARRARAGDKQAQLELGVRYEEGRGVPPDLKRARALYQSAASGSGGRQLVVVPGSSSGSRPTVVPISTGPRSPGISEAITRLKRLSDPIREDSSTRVYIPDAPSRCQLRRRIPDATRYLQEVMGSGDRFNFDCIYKVIGRKTISDMADRGSIDAQYLELFRKNPHVHDICRSPFRRDLERLATRGHIQSLISSGTVARSCGDISAAIEYLTMAYDKGADFLRPFIAQLVSQSIRDDIKDHTKP